MASQTTDGLPGRTAVTEMLRCYQEIVADVSRRYIITSRYVLLPLHCFTPASALYVGLVPKMVATHDLNVEYLYEE